ncbi:MAG: phosphate regulon transcriptional regulator PhoB [Gammaproteobacteria bacterium]|nr:phosphate regulon transcriptional regulator PhoB [Gammaproteobacteria bacterium]
MTDKNILVVEDDAAVRQMIRFNLSRAGYAVIEAADCSAAREALGAQRPHLILMDWMMPNTTGLEFTRALKRDPDLRTIPVIMLTAKSMEQDKIAGLDGGADDYITKPFSPRELISRINAVLRRSEPEDATPGSLTFADLTIDTDSHRVRAGDLAVRLGPTEYRLLEHLMKHPERVYSRAQLLDSVWGTNVYLEERTVDVHIRRLRKALQDTGCAKHIQTVRGAGYRLSRHTD